MDPEDGFNYLVSEAQQEYLLDPANVEYARQLTQTAIMKVNEIDQAIDDVSVGWPVSGCPKLTYRLSGLPMRKRSF